MAQSQAGKRGRWASGSGADAGAGRGYGASDVDLVVRFEPGRSLLDQGGLMMELRELLGADVDVVSEGALVGRFGERVRREAVPS